MLYRLVKFFIKIGLKLYYSEIKLRKADNLLHDGPMIIIANHPNTLIDAFLIGMLAPQPIYYMAKGTFFDSNWKMKFLRSFNMIPINRANESRTKGVDNSATFEECYQLLEKGKTLVIFPEGSSFMEFQLRELKSGTARIALEAQARNSGSLNLKIVPVGLMYTQGEKFRSSILVNCGEGISVDEYLDEYHTNVSLAAKKLTVKFREMLENVLVTTKNREQERLVLQLNEMLQSRYKKQEQGVESDVQRLKDIRDRIAFLSIHDPQRLEFLQLRFRNLQWKTNQNEIKDDFLDRGIRSGMFIRQVIFSIIGVVIGLPLFLVGIIHNILPYYFVDKLIPKISTSKEFYAPLAILLSMVAYPINYALFGLLFNYLFDPSIVVIILYFILLPILGLYSFWFAHYLSHVSYKLTFISLIKTNKEWVLELKEQRMQIFRLLFEDSDNWRSF